MPRTDQRRLPLLVVLVAMLGMLGVVVADGWGARGAASSGADAVTRSAAEVGLEDVTVQAATEHATGAGATIDSRATISAKATGEIARGLAPSLRRVGHPVDRSGFVQVAADQVRPLAQNAPALLVLAAVFVAVVGARSVARTLATAVARPLPLAHVRRRGPPALAVV